jgi:hypothetical protein
MLATILFLNTNRNLVNQTPSEIIHISTDQTLFK